jgi:glutamate transport system permease protein
MSTTSILYDAPGPRTRRLTVIGSIVTGALLLAGLFWVLRRLSARGQFDSLLWQPFTDPGIQHTVLIGVLATVKAAALAIVLAIALGALLAFGRLSEHRVLRLPSTVIVETARAIPLLLLMLALFLAFPRALGAFGALVLGLTLYNGAVLAEVFRAGIGSVPRGQSEAGYALGLRKYQLTTLILLPQAVRAMLPALISQCVVTLKDTALGYIITYPELLSSGKAIFNVYFNIIPTTLVIAAIYIVLNSSLSGLATQIQRRVARGRAGRRGVPPVVATPADAPLAGAGASTGVAPGPPPH